VLGRSYRRSVTAAAHAVTVPAILLFITIVNLRGVVRTGAVFIVSDYLFVGALFITLGLGLVTSLAAGVSGAGDSSLAASPQTAAVSAWVLLKAFSSGCHCDDRVEAVSNGGKHSESQL